jgi:regulatory protein
MSNLAYSDMSFDNYFQAPTASKSDIKAIKATALRYLARREYSRLELFRKLSQKYASGSDIQSVLDQLQEQGYQSDDRFTEMFIRTKVRAGNGPFKIKIELREKGICESTALSAFDRQSIDWLQIAHEVKNKRFGYKANIDIDVVSSEEASPVIEITELAKQIRYLKNKGFYQEHIEKVVKI